jgi:hypothetical protein
MTIYLVWTSYESVDAAFFHKEDAERWIDEYIRDNPTYGGYRPRDRGDFGITHIEVK